MYTPGETDIATRMKYPPGSTISALPPSIWPLKDVENEIPQPPLQLTQQTISFLTLPDEVQERIFLFTMASYNTDVPLPDSDRWGTKILEDITLTPGWDIFEFNNSYFGPAVFSDLQSVLEACIGTSAEACLAQTIGRTHQFWSSICDPLRKLPKVLGETKLIFICNLDVKFNASMEGDHEKLWPDFLKFMTDYMPHLSKFRLYKVAAYYPRIEEPNTTDAREYAEMLRLMAFIVLRRTGTHRLILPANSGPSYEELRSSPCDHAELSFVVEKTEISTSEQLQRLIGHVIEPEAFRVWDSEQKCTSINDLQTYTVEDEVLKATAIRRMTMSELKTHRPHQFILVPRSGKTKDSIISSEVPEDTNFYAIVDSRAYQTRDEHKLNLWKYRTADEMIRFARSRELRFRKVQRRREHEEELKRRQMGIVGLNVHAVAFALSGMVDG